MSESPECNAGQGVSILVHVTEEDGFDKLKLNGILGTNNFQKKSWGRVHAIEYIFFYKR